MPKQARRVRASSELAVALREAEREGTPVELEANGATYDVVRSSSAQSSGESRTAYDPNKLVDALKKYGGSWADVDADEMIAAIYRAREEGSRPADRP